MSTLVARLRSTDNACASMELSHRSTRDIGASGAWIATVETGSMTVPPNSALLTDANASPLRARRGGKTRTLDLTMSWQPRFHNLRHPRKRPRPKGAASSVPRKPVGQPLRHLSGPRDPEARNRRAPCRGSSTHPYRAKRLRAVELYRRRFSRVPKLKEYSMRQLPRLGE